MAKNFLSILYEDEQLIALDKPAGLRTIPDRFDTNLPSAYSLLQVQHPHIFIVHRLDKDTSGVLLFAKNEQAHAQLNRDFSAQKIEKKYLGLVMGTITKDEQIIDAPLQAHPTKAGIMRVHPQGKTSQTLLHIRERFIHYTWVSFMPKTGRTHQIRLHCAHLHHPLVGDTIYAEGHAVMLSRIKKGKYKLGRDEVERPLLSRLALHAHTLQFTHPHRQEKITITADLPKDLAATLQQLRKYDT